jgi:2,3,4,5-tetrahydropyridine-2-carboxylate N-succinyltransferase
LTTTYSQIRSHRVGIGCLADPPVDAHDVYLRLHLLSHRLVRSHGPSLDGVFSLLANVAWTKAGPCPAGDFE